MGSALTSTVWMAEDAKFTVLDPGEAVAVIVRVLTGAGATTTDCGGAGAGWPDLAS
jgi:hypothetical protein